MSHKKINPVKTRLISEKTLFHGSDILSSEKMLSEKNFIQHGNISCFEHSVNVAETSLVIARFLSIRIDEKSLVRGALLHDYFLYDWHKSDKRLHGFYHPGYALKNADRDFVLNAIERNIIKRHMFPLTFFPPRYRESWIVCIADKLCALQEIFMRKAGVYEKRPN